MFLALLTYVHNFHRYQFYHLLVSILCSQHGILISGYHLSLSFYQSNIAVDALNANLNGGEREGRYQSRGVHSIKKGRVIKKRGRSHLVLCVSV